MPRVRQRSASRELSSSATLLRLFAVLCFSDASSEEDELLGLLAFKASIDHQRAAIMAQRIARGPYGAAKTADSVNLLVYTYGERWFRAWLRMSRPSFWALVDKISDDPGLRSSGLRPQAPVWYQLAVFLIRWSNASALRTAGVMAVAEGSVYNYCARISKAFRRIKPEHLWWPGDQRRAFLKEEMGGYGFPGCIGMVDGTLFKLSEKPQQEPYSYYTRKQFYGLAVQATCDHRSIFTSYDMGWPGCMNDATVFKRSTVWEKTADHFTPEEYILADKGYPLSKHVIRPFSEPELDRRPELKRNRRAWNKHLSRLRIKVEHAFGLLKGRFPTLRDIPGRNLDTIYKGIEALMVIHNILIELGDDPEDIEGFNGQEDAGLGSEEGNEEEGNGQRRNRHRMGAHHQNATLESEDAYLLGLARRKWLVDYFLEM